jgi:hypothetical protein
MIEVKFVYSIFRLISLFARETEQFSDRRTQEMSNNKSESQKSISIHTAITPKNNFASVIPVFPPFPFDLLFFNQRFRMFPFISVHISSSSLIQDVLLKSA